MRIAGYHSKHTMKGMRRIRDILSPNYNVEVKPPPDAPDLIILHNVMPTVHQKDIPTIVFLCENSAMSVPASLEFQRQLGHYADEVWMSCKAGQDALRGVGIDSELMYRPNKLIFPQEHQPFTEDKRLLWYWISDLKKYEDIREESAQTIMELGRRGWQIDYISSANIGEPPVMADWTRVFGKVSFPDIMPEVRGMVQINTSRGIGRSCFQVLAYGRPVIGMNLYDEGFHSLCMADNWADRIEDALSQDVPYQWTYTEFSEEALNRKWVARVEGVIG